MAVHTPPEWSSFNYFTAQYREAIYLNLRTLRVCVCVLTLSVLVCMCKCVFLSVCVFARTFLCARALLPCAVRAFDCVCVCLFVYVGLNDGSNDFHICTRKSEKKSDSDVRRKRDERISDKARTARELDKTT